MVMHDICVAGSCLCMACADARFPQSRDDVLERIPYRSAAELLIGLMVFITCINHLFISLVDRFPTLSSLES